MQTRIFRSEVIEANNAFRNVRATTPSGQVVLMNLKPDDVVPWETHERTGQLIVVGSGGLFVNVEVIKDGVPTTTTIVAGVHSCVFIPAGTKHELRASSAGAHILSFYTAPEHMDGLVQFTSADAKVQENVS